MYNIEHLWYNITLFSAGHVIPCSVDRLSSAIPNASYECAINNQTCNVTCNTGFVTGNGESFIQYKCEGDSWTPTIKLCLGMNLLLYQDFYCYLHQYVVFFFLFAELSIPVVRRLCSQSRDHAEAVFDSGYCVKSNEFNLDWLVCFTSL